MENQLAMKGGPGRRVVAMVSLSASALPHCMHIRKHTMVNELEMFD